MQRGWDMRENNSRPRHPMKRDIPLPPQKTKTETKMNHVRCKIVNPNIPHIYRNIVLVRQHIAHISHSPILLKDPLSHPIKRRLPK
jgi:hypothetical protein